jgi:transcriptional regulator with XRE-family HTH domain
VELRPPLGVPLYPPGLRLRQTREALGPTNRDVEKASYQIAVRRGRPGFILHNSRLADIENRGVVPSLYKLYSLATILHLDPLEISNWYQAPFRETLQEGASFPSPRTHLSESPRPKAVGRGAEHTWDSEYTELLQARPAEVVPMPHVERSANSHYRYGYVGLSDRRMVSLLRPGSTVLIDTTLRRIEDTECSNEYDRPMYFVELRNGYRCGWFQKGRSRRIMQPHTLPRCAPKAWRTPEDAEIVAQVVGVISYLSEPWAYCPASVPEERSNWSKKVL